MTEQEDNRGNNPRSCDDVVAQAGPFSLYRQSRVLVCDTCGVGVSGTKKAITKHIKKHPSSTFEDITALDALLSSKPLMCKDTQEIKEVQRKGYHAGLAVKPGFACPAIDCVFASESLEWMKKHIGQHTPPIRTPLENLPCQTLFTKPASDSHSTFQVKLEDLPSDVRDAFEKQVHAKNQPTSSITTGPCMSDTYDRSWVSSFDAFEDEQRILRAESLHQHSDDPGQQTMWAKRTQFSTMLDGYNISELKSLTSLPEKMLFDDDTIWQHSLVPVLKDLFGAWSKYAQSQCSRVLRQFRTTDSNPLASYSSTPMRIVACSAGYCITFIHFMVFLLRATRPGSPYTGLDLCPEIATAVERVRSHIPPMLPFDQTCPFSSDALSRACEQLSVAVAQHQFTRHEKESPFIHFLAIHSYNPFSRTFLSAYEVEPYLSHLIYLLRIIGISHAMKHTPDHDVPRSIDQYCALNLRENSRSPFGWIFSLFLYAKRVATTHYNLPTTQWTEDGSALDYCGARLRLKEFQDFVRQRCQALRDFACERLLFRPQSFLDSRSARNIRDDPLWEVAGHHFGHLTELNPHLLDAWRCTFFDPDAHAASEGLQSLHTLMKTAPGRSLSRDELLPLRTYSRNVDDLIQQIAVLVYLLSGSPPRGTDLTAIQSANSPTSRRGIYVFDGELAVVHLTNKTEALTEQPNMIARFMPAEVSDVIISLLVDVIPFERYLYWKVGQPLKRHPTYLFGEFPLGTSQRSEWASQRLMDAVEADPNLNFPSNKFSLRHSRHIMIAIDRRIRPDPHQSLGLENDCAAHALMAGHSEETENHHYALDTSHLVQLTEHTLNRFRRASERWWRFYGLRSAPAEPPIRNFDTCIALVERCLSAVESQGRRLQFTSDMVLRLTANTPSPTVRSRKRPLVERPEETPLKRRYPDQEEEALELVRKAIGDRKASWRSEGQRAAVVKAVFQEIPHLVLAIPPGHGKSAVVHALALRHPSSITVVITPYAVLRDQYQRDLRSMGIQSSSWSSTSRSGVVLVTPETIKESLQLLGWMSTVKAQLRAIVFDECHVVATEQEFRPKILTLVQALTCAALSDELKCQLILMSGTLPSSILASVLSEFRREHAYVGSLLEPTAPGLEWQMVEQPLKPSNVKLIVRVMEMEETDLFIAKAICRVRSSLNPSMRILIITRTKDQADAVAAQHGLQPFTGETKQDDRDSIIQQLQSLRVAVGTTALTTGVNLPAPLTHVLHLGACHGMSQCFQAATRGGRDGSPSWFVNILDPSKSSRCPTVSGGGFVRSSSPPRETEESVRLATALRLMTEDPAHTHSFARTREVEAYQRFSLPVSSHCRWTTITDYFNDSTSNDACGSSCDVCCPQFSSMPLLDVCFPPTEVPVDVTGVGPAWSDESISTIQTTSSDSSWLLLPEVDQAWSQDLDEFIASDAMTEYHTTETTSVALPGNSRPVLWSQSSFQHPPLTELFEAESSWLNASFPAIVSSTEASSFQNAGSCLEQPEMFVPPDIPTNAYGVQRCVDSPPLQHSTISAAGPSTATSESEWTGSSRLTHVSNTTSRSLSSVTFNSSPPISQDCPSMQINRWGGEFIHFDQYTPVAEVEAHVIRFLGNNTSKHMFCFNQARYTLFHEIYRRGHCLPCFLSGRLDTISHHNRILACPLLSPAQRSMLGQKKKLKNKDLPKGVCFRCGFSSRDGRFHPGPAGRTPSNCVSAKESLPDDASDMLWDVILLATADPQYHSTLATVGNSHSHFRPGNEPFTFTFLESNWCLQFSPAGPDKSELRWWGEKAFLYVSMVAWYRWELLKLRSMAQGPSASS